MQTQDEVEGLHKCREFSQPLECLYQDMQTQEKSFLICCFYKTEKKRKTLLFRALIKRQILTSCEVLYTKVVRVISPCFAKKDAFENTGLSRLKCQLKRKKIDKACF